MRIYEFITPLDSNDKPLFNFYINGNIAFISNFVIPEHMRGTGIGRKLYNNWEANLPSSVTHIQLRAKNNNAKSFWKKLGFNELYPNVKSDDGSTQMIKSRQI